MKAEPTSRTHRVGLASALSALQHRDFALFWAGAFLSFCGSWVQTFGQQALVYEMTGSKLHLGLITFIGAIPLFFSPFFGWIADRCNKRVVLVICQTAFALSALTLFISLKGNWASFELMCGLAFMNGLTSVVEIPTRQSLISRVVPPEDLASAIPLNAAAFNGARIVGPWIGGLLLVWTGYSTLYLINAISFVALISAVLAIRSDLRATEGFATGIRESLFEGMRYVWMTPAFRLLVLMLITNSLFGLNYFSQLAAFSKSHLGLNEAGLSHLMTCVGLGAVAGLIGIAAASRAPLKGWIPLVSMLGFGLSLLGLTFANSFPTAGAACVFLGVFGAGHMAGTNTALQYYAPPELRGRVVSVHAWALGGIWPIGSLLLGNTAQQIGLIPALRIGSVVVLIVAILAFAFGSAVKQLE